MSTTANFGWTKPVDQADSDVWGAELNTTLDDIDTDLKTVSDAANAAAAGTGAYDATDAGGVNTLVGVYSPAITVHTDGQVLRIKVANTNTGDTTFNPGPGAVQIVQKSGGSSVTYTSLTANALIAGQIATLVRNSTIGKYILVDGPQPATTAIVTAKTDSRAFVTPLSLENHPNAVHAAAWITTDGSGDPTLVSGLNVTAVTKETGTGYYSITIGAAYVGLGVPMLNSVYTAVRPFILTPVARAVASTKLYFHVWDTNSNPINFTSSGCSLIVV